MPDVVQPPTPREFYRTLKERWFIAMASGIGVLAWATGVIFPKVGAVQIILIAAMTAVILSAYHIWAQERAKLVAALGQLVQSETAADTLDVQLRCSYPGAFTLQARGNAREIRTGPIVQETGFLGLHKDGDRTMRCTTQRYTIEFPLVGELRDGEKEVVVPSLFCGEGYSRSAWPEEVSRQMAAFFLNAENLRRVAIGEPDIDAMSRAEIDDILTRRRKEFRFSFDVTFWNSETTQQWAQRELLVYEPSTGMAHVRHIGSPQPLPLQRHLQSKDAAEMARVASEGVDVFRKQTAELGAILGWSEEKVHLEVAIALKVMITCIGTDKDTLEYRNDLAAALSSAGFEAFLDEWLPGPPEFDAYNSDTVTVLDGSPSSLMRPIILSALRSAGIRPMEAEVDWVRLPTRGRRQAGPKLVALVVGRGR